MLRAVNLRQNVTACQRTRLRQGYGGQVRASQTQSDLIGPNQTIIFFWKTECGSIKPKHSPSDHVRKADFKWVHHPGHRLLDDRIASVPYFRQS
jgi:hypothetical protein